MNKSGNEVRLRQQAKNKTFTQSFLQGDDSNIIHNAYGQVSTEGNDQFHGLYISNFEPKKQNINQDFPQYVDIEMTGADVATSPLQNMKFSNIDDDHYGP